MTMFSQRLKLIRQLNNLTQKNLADFLQISERAYQNYEYGNREPNFESAIKLADYFKVSLDYLVGRSDNPKIN